MAPELLLAGTIGVALCLYFLFAGADFGGGVWDLLASGPRAAAQRRAIATAIGPVWEANHVWLILVIVVLFTGFPTAFAAISVALHVPLTLFIVGVVLRGSAFAFRSLDMSGDRAQRQFGLVFSIASTIAPVLLGMIVAALVSGNIRVSGGTVFSGFWETWLGLFPFAVGLISLALCALLAATYLCVEIADPELREDFRRRALAAAIGVGVAALLAFVFAHDEAPRVQVALVMNWPFHVPTGAAAVTAIAALATRRYRLARAAVAAQTVLILVGWALAQYPYLIVPWVTLHEAAASPRTQWLLLSVLAAGVPVLVPSLWLLYRVFKAPVQADRAP
ncbi:MAG TPA: cytochrome d ubiquinol oxidase subunit II [Polyangia bacterium]|nr:cytochrome d ubiquinol oxidase subunit II [Polyangia bacterium]